MHHNFHHLCPTGDAKKIIAISAGQNFRKKDFHCFQQHMHYLNYGLLGLATLIKQFSNHEIRMFQADGSVSELLNTIASNGIDIQNDCDYILLSIPSSYSVSWSAEFCEEIHKRSTAKIIVGGRWVVDHHADWIHEKLKYESVIIQGFGEGPLTELLGIELPPSRKDGSKNCFEWLDYTLLHSYQKYNPSIEISRGCGSGCLFCADSHFPRLRNKSVDQVMRELDLLDQLYGKYNVYLEAPHFVFENEWINTFSQQMQTRQRIVPWRCTTRVETIPINKLGMLAASGLKVLDVGLESASATQLRRMHKTNNPERYLAAAERLLDECNKHGIFVKFNILLYAGETMETVEETAQWLERHKKQIKGISANGLVYYHNMSSYAELAALGASFPENNQFEEEGYCALNLSPEISAADAVKIGRRLSGIVADQRDFYDLKAFSYFEPGYSYEEFLEDLHSCDAAALPFRVEE